MNDLPAPVSLFVSGYTLNFHFFCTVNGDAREKVMALREYFARVPAAHLAEISKAMIVIVRRLSGGRCTSGGFDTSLRNWIGRERRTGIPDTFFAFRQSQHIIAITQDAFNDNTKRHFTVLHECAHCVHQTFPIYPRRATLQDYRGIYYPRSNHVEEYAAETYSRYIICPHRIGRSGHRPAGESIRRCSERLTGMLMASPCGLQFSQVDRRGGDDFASGGLPFVSPW